MTEETNLTTTGSCGSSCQLFKAEVVHVRSATALVVIRDRINDDGDEITTPREEVIRLAWLKLPPGPNPIQVKKEKKVEWSPQEKASACLQELSKQYIRKRCLGKQVLIEILFYTEGVASSEKIPNAIIHPAGSIDGEGSLNMELLLLGFADFNKGPWEHRKDRLALNGRLEMAANAAKERGIGVHNEDYTALLDGQGRVVDLVECNDKVKLSHARATLIKAGRILVYVDYVISPRSISVVAFPEDSTRTGYQFRLLLSGVQCVPNALTQSKPELLSVEAAGLTMVRRNLNSRYTYARVEDQDAKGQLLGTLEWAKGGTSSVLSMQDFLLREGLAVVDPRSEDRADFVELQKLAINGRKGIWQFLDEDELDEVRTRDRVVRDKRRRQAELDMPTVSEDESDKMNRLERKYLFTSGGEQQQLLKPTSVYP